MNLSRLKSFFQNRSMVLMYHRIHSPLTDPWDLSVSPENFKEQLQYLKNKYTIISADELVEQLISGSVKNRSVVLTFDDGYQDNFETARPILEKYSVPATFFITDSYLGSGQSFWWDELEKVIVQTPSLPEAFSISFKGKTIEFNLANEADLSDELRLLHSNRKATNPPTLRTELYLKLWKLCRPLTRSEQAKLIKKIREWAGLSEIQTRTEGAMTADQVKVLSENSLFTIGGHTKNHLALASHPAEIQENEIINNHTFLEELTNKKVNYFAYPSGDYNSTTTEILEREYTAAFTTHSAPVTQHTDLFEISRVQVKNWSKDKFKNKLKISFRKTHKIV